jgi:hypothetical protein
MGSGLVDAAVAKRKLVTQGKSELAEPPVIGPGLPNPDGTRVIHMGLLVGVLGESQPGLRPVRRVEELGSFKDHLYDMLVAMMFRSFAGIEGKEEDVHGGYGSISCPPQICFDQHR